VKEAADLLSVRPILGSLLAKKEISVDEKDALMDFLAGVEEIDEAAILEAGNKSSNKETVIKALSDVLQRNDYKPPELHPRQPDSSPDNRAGSKTITELAQGFML
jgi:hypothetical protein